MNVRVNRLKIMVDHLTEIVRFADQEKDFVLAAKMEEARCALIERLRVCDSLRS